MPPWKHNWIGSTCTVAHLNNMSFMLIKASASLQNIQTKTLFSRFKLKKKEGKEN